jgi:hypothetical protein
MEKLPLRPPNTNASDPQINVDMINSVMNLKLMFPLDGSQSFIDRGLNSVPKNCIAKRTYHTRAPGVVDNTV